MAFRQKYRNLELHDCFLFLSVPLIPQSNLNFFASCPESQFWYTAKLSQVHIFFTLARSPVWSVYTVLYLKVLKINPYEYKFKTCNVCFFSGVAPSLLKFVGKNYGFVILYSDASRFLKSNQFSQVIIKAGKSANSSSAVVFKRCLDV